MKVRTKEARVKDEYSFDGKCDEELSREDVI
jgi:hypothetical protein